MSDQRGPRGRRRLCVWVRQDLADWLDAEAKLHGSGREVYIENALADMKERYERDRLNPRPYVFDDE